MEQRQEHPAERWPADPTCLVYLAIREIDDGEPEAREILLADFLCAAWPSISAQNQ